MSNENAELIRRAYQAYASGDLAGMLALVDPDLEWTYLACGPSSRRSRAAARW